MKDDQDLRLTMAIVVLAVIATGVVGAMMFGASRWRSKTDDLRTTQSRKGLPNQFGDRVCSPPTVFSALDGGTWSMGCCASA